MVDDTYNPENQITQSKLKILKTLGYTGTAYVEDLMQVINNYLYQRGLHKTANGLGWWVEYKNRTENLGKSFPNIIFTYLQNILKQ